jgi:hypothetical protein
MRQHGDKDMLSNWRSPVGRKKNLSCSRPVNVVSSAEHRFRGDLFDMLAEGGSSPRRMELVGPASGAVANIVIDDVRR